jgi:hypothetical protein
MSGDFYYGVARSGDVACSNMWSASGSEISGGCSDCNYAFEVDHTVVSEDCGSSDDFTWSISWPYSYGSYELVAVEYYGSWYPQGWLTNYTSSEVYWYAVFSEDDNGYYYFMIGDYSVY